jgi:L-2-hydroxyglutarate oxidase
MELDLAIVGSGVIGLSIGNSYLEQFPNAKVAIFEKEPTVGMHASSRNSGVIHAGFYYSPESIKARFCRDGNIALKDFCKTKGIPVLETGKLIVTQNKNEEVALEELYKRGILNGIDIELLDRSKIRNYEPLASTHSRFIWSPTTAVANPIQVIKAMQEDFLKKKGKIIFDNKIKLKTDVTGKKVVFSQNAIRAQFFVNAAGSYANQIYENIGIESEYNSIPFIGNYVKATNSIGINRLVYPVPHKVNPFLGIHITVTADGQLKIGPTAFPILGKEAYKFVDFKHLNEIPEILQGYKFLIKGDKHDFSQIIASEWTNFFTPNLVKKASRLAPTIKKIEKWERGSSGIRSQLIDKKTGELVQDFIVRKHLNSIHLLNVVSPGWTAAIPFGRYITSLISI